MSSFYPRAAHKSIVQYHRKQRINWQELKRVIIFIDAANLENSVKDLGWWIDYQKMLNFFQNQTQLVGIYFYCPHFNTASQDRFLTVLKKLSYQLRTKPLKIIQNLEAGHTRKANFDVEISLDAILLLNQYDTLILFSGDSDFKALLERLRTYHKQIIVISSRGHISWELARAADDYIPLDVIKEYIQREKIKSPRKNTGEVDNS